MNRKESFIAKLLKTSSGERPGKPCSTVRGDKRTGEVNRVLAASHKSAEPVEAEHTGTSAPVAGSARESAKERETEPMADASSNKHGPRQCGGGRVGRKAGGVSIPSGFKGIVGRCECTGQPVREPVRRTGQLPHGVESAPTADKRLSTEPENRAYVSWLRSCRTGIIEATDDRGCVGRSLRSSPRAGKPSTWRRQAVGMVSRQEVGLCPTR